VAASIMNRGMSAVFEGIELADKHYEDIICYFPQDFHLDRCWTRFDLIKELKNYYLR